MSRLEVRDLSCRYADPTVQALAGVSLYAAPGELAGWQLGRVEEPHAKRGVERLTQLRIAGRRRIRATVSLHEGPAVRHPGGRPDIEHGPAVVAGVSEG